MIFVWFDFEECMKKIEFDRLSVWSIVENRKTHECFEVQGKQENRLLFSDGVLDDYRKYTICQEKTEFFGSVLGYDFLRNRWIFDCKAYLVNKKWYWLWNHEYVRDLDDFDIRKIESVRQQYPEKNMLSAEDCV